MPLNSNVKALGLPSCNLQQKKCQPVSGDYYQALFDSEDRDGDQGNPFDQPEPYVLVQRQFESFDGGKCYIESHDEEYIGHFKLKLVEFSTTRLAYEIARRDHTFVE